jgi:predicted double-glycine peptidase
MIWLAIQLAGSALMIAAGVWALRRSPALATGLVAAMCLLLILKAVICHLPAAEPRLFPWNWYPYVEPWWTLFPAMFIFGAGSSLVRASMLKRDVLLVGGGFLLLRCGVVAVLTDQSHELLTAVVRENGVCLQSSSYSCAPASAAMFLHLYGVTATENEMARLCVTRSGSTVTSGTSESGLLRGLRIKLMDRATPMISTPAYEKIPTPSLVTIEVRPRTGHSILVSAVEPGQVRVLDPRYGPGVLPRAQFEKIWQKSAIHVQPH